MFPKNSAFSKSQETEEYEEGVRQRALNSAQGRSDEIEKMVRETKEMVGRLLDQRESVDGSDKHESRARQKRAKPHRPY